MKRELFREAVMRELNIYFPDEMEECSPIILEDLDEFISKVEDAPETKREMDEDLQKINEKFAGLDEQLDRLTIISKQ